MAPCGWPKNGVIKNLMLTKNPFRILSLFTAILLSAFIRLGSAGKGKDGILFLGLVLLFFILQILILGLNIYARDFQKRRRGQMKINREPRERPYIDEAHLRSIFLLKERSSVGFEPTTSGFGDPRSTELIRALSSIQKKVDRTSKCTQ